MSMKVFTAAEFEAQLAEARDWIADCGWRDLEPEEVAELSPEQIMGGVNRHYVGGWASFVTEMAVSA